MRFLALDIIRQIWQTVRNCPIEGMTRKLTTQHPCCYKHNMGVVMVENMTELARAQTSPVAAYLASLSRGESRRTQASALRRVAKIFGDQHIADMPWHELRAEHTNAIRQKLAEQYQPATANSSIAAMKGVLKHAWLMNLLPTDAYHKAVSVGSVRGSRLPSGKVLDDEGVFKLMASCPTDTIAGLRDRAAIALMVGAGLRRAEAAGCQLSDYSNGTITIIGKGNKEREVPLARGGAEAIEQWISVRGKKPGPLLYRVTAAQTIVQRGISPEALRQMLQRLTKRNVVTPHDLRRTHITRLLEAHADVLTVSRMAGHSDPATTARYDRRNARAASEAAARVGITQ